MKGVRFISDRKPRGVKKPMPITEEERIKAEELYGKGMNLADISIALAVPVASLMFLARNTTARKMAEIRKK
jgi:hypothetical protein